MSADVGSPTVSVILLDTNVLHYLDLYTKNAKKHRWCPFGNEKADFGSDKKLRKAFRDGKTVMRFIQESGAQVQYSPISELELLAGRLRGKALLKAAQQGIPHRMWSLHSENEVSRRLKPNTFRDVHQGIDNLLDILGNELGVDAVVSHGERMIEVWDIARGLSKIVFLDPADCVIYASALAVGATYFVTADGYLWQMANKINTSPKKGKGAQVRALLADVSPVDTVPTLPEAKRPTDLRKCATVK